LPFRQLRVRFKKKREQLDFMIKSRRKHEQYCSKEPGISGNGNVRLYKKGDGKGFSNGACALPSVFKK
jgi:hypothetical protein